MCGNVDLREPFENDLGTDDEKSGTDDKKKAIVDGSLTKTTTETTIETGRWGGERYVR